MVKVGVIAGLLLTLAASCLAQEHPHPNDEKLGTVHFATSWNEAAQKDINRAVALLHSFQFSRAIEGFNAALGEDATCGIAYWGIALSDWSNPFAAGMKDKGQLQAGRESAEHGETVGAKTERERAYLPAVGKLYGNYETTPQQPRLIAYREAMEEVATLTGFAAISDSLPASMLGQSAESLYNEAGKAYENGDVQHAINLYQKLLRIAPNLIQARTNLGVALAHEGRYSEAIAQYRSALKQDPDNPTVRLDLTLAWYKQADFARAAAELELLRKRHPENKQALYLLADCYLRLGKYRATVQLLDPIYQSSPDDLAVDYALGTALIQDGKTKKGEIVIDRVLKNGNSAEANLLIGASQFEAGDFKKAVEALNRALQANPNLPGGWTIYGRALIGASDNEGAKSAFRRALAADPNDFDANLHLGALLRHDGENDAAEPYLTHALQLRPESPAAQLQVGALNASTGHLGQARKQLEAVVKRWPDFLEAHVQLASLYARMNLPENSARERKIVLALNAKARREGPQPEQ